MTIIIMRMIQRGIGIRNILTGSKKTYQCIINWGPVLNVSRDYSITFLNKIPEVKDRSSIGSALKTLAPSYC